MARRTLVIFWGSLTAAAFLLGSGVSSLRALLGGGGTADVILLATSAVGLTVTVFVAGRIVLFAARLQRRTQREA